MIDPTNPLAFLQQANQRGMQSLATGGDVIAAMLAAQQQQAAAAPSHVSASPVGSSVPLKGPNGKLYYPTNTRRITEGYGPRVHPITGKRGFHTGEDIGARYSAPVYATANGVISKSQWNNIYGNQIVLNDGGNLQSMYGHLSKSLVKAGQSVKKGQIIGYVGSTGLSTGAHLHFEVWYNGKPVNPNAYL